MKRFFILASLLLVIGCSNGETPEVDQDTSGTNTNEVKTSDISIRFGGIDVVTKRDAIQVTGEVQTDEDHFYYTLDDEGEVIVEETMIEVNNEAGDWNTFTLEIDIKDEDFTVEDIPLLTFYAKDDQRIINPNYVPVDLMIY